MKNKSTIISFLISFLVVASLIAIFTWNMPGDRVPTEDKVEKKADTPAPKDTGADASNQIDQTNVVTPPAPPKPTIDPSRVQISSAALMDTLVNLFKNHDPDVVSTLAEHNVIDDETASIISSAAGQSKPLALEQPIVEIGSWDSGRKVRYRINFADGTSGIVDLHQGEDKLWTIHSLILPGAAEGPESGDANLKGVLMQDAMGVTERFMKAVLGSDFATATAMVDPQAVSNATIAGLCILFEEGEYALRAKNALKGSFIAERNAGFLIYLTGRNGAAANMGVALKRKDNDPWLISEVALDSLLASYVDKVAEGEDTYVPLVKNPKGGDSLVLFFGFNEDSLTPRSLKQLGIVAEIVKLSPDKKLEISGHTDDVGSEKYNQGLSERRAAAVKAALVASGVPAESIETRGFGKSAPRRSYGSEDSIIQRDEARRVNRRAEMYLDF